MTSLYILHNHLSSSAYSNFLLHSTDMQVGKLIAKFNCKYVQVCECWTYANVGGENWYNVGLAEMGD